jgi:hypothetical protein
MWSVRQPGLGQVVVEMEMEMVIEEGGPIPIYPEMNTEELFCCSIQKLADG